MSTLKMTISNVKYIAMLEMIINNSTNSDDVVWAKFELSKYKEVDSNESK